MYKTPVVSSVNILAIFCETRPYFFFFCKVEMVGEKHSCSNHSLQHSQQIFRGQTGKIFFLFVLRQFVFEVSTRKRLMGVKDNCFSVEVITLMLGSTRKCEIDPKGGGIHVFQPQYYHFSVCILPE